MNDMMDSGMMWGMGLAGIIGIVVIVLVIIAVLVTSAFLLRNLLQ
jgi:hypothetical protein